MTEIKKLGFSCGLTESTSIYYPPSQDQITNKINELISAINEQQKMIDFIMKNTEVEVVGNKYKFLKEIYEEKN